MRDSVSETQLYGLGIIQLLHLAINYPLQVHHSVLLKLTPDGIVRNTQTKAVKNAQLVPGHVELVHQMLF